jgi:hypothetical protein
LGDAEQSNPSQPVSSGTNPDTKVIIGLWKVEESAAMRERIGLSEPDKIATSLADLAYQIHVLSDHPS